MMVLPARNEAFMSEHLTPELFAYVSDALSLERLSLRLLQDGLRHARDPKVAAIYREHALQTEEHLRLIRESLGSGHTSEANEPKSVSVGALRIEFAEQAAGTPTHLAIGVYALENVEIAVYHLLLGIAEASGDIRTAGVLRHILEAEEETAELLASTLDRVLPGALTDIAARGAPSLGA
jgi:ferritin-like metal-binding protein YciE